ncbi:MAG TPA: response regulator [Candidatus Acidoferrum sp.]|jgi:twitching motility two-component system response regulator PilH
MSEEALTLPPPEEAAVKRAPTVYFIDDSATMREVIKIAFRREHINVITCADAASALAQFEQNRPDVVITDVIMPDQDGYAVCSQIKQHPEFGGIPVVLMSGVVNKSVADKAISVKADELIRKPFQPQELIGRVKTLLGPKDAPAPAPRERATSHALQSLFAPPPAPVAAPPAAPVQPVAAATVHEVPAEPVWPRALAEAFTPLLQPLAPYGTSQAHNAGTPSVAPAGTQQPASSAEVAKLRGELARLELLVKKLQTELQLEREYNQALEQQIRTLNAAS